MEIKLFNKINGHRAGCIKSKDFNHNCIIEISYNGKEEMIKEIQKVLIKYYKLKYVSGESNYNKISCLVIPEVEITKSRRHGSLSQRGRTK
jgi:hypothetical protein